MVEITGDALLKGLSYRGGAVMNATATPFTLPSSNTTKVTTYRSNGASSAAFSALAGAAGVLAAVMML